MQIARRWATKLRTALNFRRKEQPTLSMPQKPLPLQGISILIVQAEDAIPLIFIRKLQAMGCEVVHARSGGEAVTLWSDRKGRFHLLIADINFCWSGSEKNLPEILRKEYPHLPVIYLIKEMNDFYINRMPAESTFFHTVSLALSQPADKVTAKS